MAPAPRWTRSITTSRPWLTLLLGLGLGYGIYLSQLGLRGPVVLIGLLPPATALALWSHQRRRAPRPSAAALNLLDPIVFSDQLGRIGRGAPWQGSKGCSWQGTSDQLEAIQSLALQCVELDDSRELEMRVLLTQLLDLAETIAEDLRLLSRATTPSSHALRQRRLQAQAQRLNHCQQQLQASHAALLGEALAGAALPELSLIPPARFPTP